MVRRIPHGGSVGGRHGARSPPTLGQAVAWGGRFLRSFAFRAVSGCRSGHRGRSGDWSAGSGRRCGARAFWNLVYQPFGAISRAKPSFDGYRRIRACSMVRVCDWGLLDAPGLHAPRSSPVPGAEPSRRLGLLNHLRPHADAEEPCSDPGGMTGNRARNTRNGIIGTRKRGSN